MKKALLIVLASLLLVSGCTKKRPDPSEVFRVDGFDRAEPFGDIPSELRGVIEGNLFSVRSGGEKSFRTRGLYPACGRVAVIETSADGAAVKLYAADGKLLAERAVQEDTRRSACFACPTEDGGFIYVLGFMDLQLVDGSWLSDGGICSKVVKCGPDGGAEWEREFPRLTHRAFLRMIERDGAYYFFGEYPEAPRDSYDHIVMLKLGADGTELARNTVAGEDFDSIRRVTQTEDGFVLHIDSQSRSGDFFPIKGEKGMHCSRYFTLAVSPDLEKKEMELAKQDYFYGSILPVGVIRGSEIYYESVGYEVPGYVTLALECGGYVLIVSENNTGMYEMTPPTVSAIWYYTETVYSVFDGEGALVCRRAYDSTPDYDGIRKAFYERQSGAN